MTGTPARTALYSIWRWSSPRGQTERRRFIRRERPPAPWRVRSSKTIAARASIAKRTRPLETQWSLWRTRRRSLWPSLLRSRRGDPPIVGLLGRELPSASEVDLLDEPDAVEWNTEESCGIACGVDPIKGVLVRVEGNSAIGLVRLRGFLPNGNDDFPRDHCQGSESPRRVAQHRAVPVRERQGGLHPLPCPNRGTSAAG